MVKQTLKKYWLFLILILVLALRLPSLFEPFTYGDEGIYLTLGQAARKGLVFYRDIHDNKPPMLYLMAALAGSFSIYRLIHFFWSFITIFAFYRLSQILFKKNFLAIISSTAIFAFLTSLHNLEGNVANAENFMLLPTIVAFLIILRTKQTSFRAWLLAGSFLSLATLFKVPAAFDFVALMVISFFLFLEKKTKNYQQFVKNFSFLLLGFLLPILTTFFYYAFQDALDGYLKAAFFQNLPYLSSWSASQPQTSGLPLALLTRGFFVFFLVIILLILRKRVSLAAKIILIWFIFSWFAALLSSRPYPHYLIQVLPALSFSFGLFFTKQKTYLKEKIIPAVLFFVFISTFTTFHFWQYENLPYYFNFYQFALGKKSQQEYFADFDTRTNSIYQVVNYLKTHSLPQEKTFIWGNDPFIYALAHRLPVGRYTVTYHIADFNGYQETIAQLKKQTPRYIIVDPQEKQPFPQFFLWLNQEYALEKQIGDFSIYHRLPNSLVLE